MFPDVLACDSFEEPISFSWNITIKIAYLCHLVIDARRVNVFTTMK